MVAMVAALAGAAIQVVKWAAKPIIRQFSYLCCFASNIDGLKQEADELDMATRGLQGQVDRDRENVRVILPQVESWLTKSNDIKGQKDTILDEVPNVKSGCFKIRARFSLSKRAIDTTDRMKELRIQKNFDPISVQGPPASTQEIPLGKTYEFESRKKFEEDIMTTLRDGDANIVGICGMGGLGKTTMAQRIMNRALKEHVFKEVVMAVISQQVDMFNVQVEIGGSLGLDLQHESSQVRVQKLHARLTGSTKRILLVLDDVWEGLELHSLGIPCDSKQCKILVTSRNKDALSEMDVQKVFEMKVLPPKDAWFLFSKRTGTCVDDAKLYPIAQKVVDECGGLPIALTVVGASLKDEKDASIWKDALRQLRKCDQDIPNFIEKVYNPLKLSYDFLRSRQAKTLLLLCCLFPEDAQIRLEQLTYFCMGLGIFEGNINLEESRDKMRSLAKMLKSRSLLLDGSSEVEVRMHDVVRDVCIFIAKRENYIGGDDCAWVSSSELVKERRSGLSFPNLRLLLVGELELDSVFLEGIRNLRVLWIKYSPLTLLPLRNLNTLVLDTCAGMETIYVVGELVNLEILICRYCNSIEELPPEIKGLNRLRLLELTGCYMLQSIRRDIISSLVGLEELKMLNSFRKWEAEDREERENASLRELQALTNLTCLEIQIENHALVAENMQISTKLDRFHVMFSKRTILHTMSQMDFSLTSDLRSYDKRISLNLERETCLGPWIEMQLLRETESLWLWGKGAKNVDLGKCQNIKWLKLTECETTKNIVTNASYDDDVDATVLPASLEHMDLRSLPLLQEMSVSLHNLSSITINGCPRLPKLSIARKDCLPQLETLHIEECEMVEQALSWSQEEDNNGESRTNPHVKFPKLKEVSLDSLPNLVTFCQGIEAAEFPLLKEIRIEKCPKWTSMVSCISSSNGDVDDEYSSHLFCQLGKVSFCNLQELEIDGNNPFCGHEIPASSSYSGLTKLKISNHHGTGSLLSYSIARNLANLKELVIYKGDGIVLVIKDDDDEEARMLANSDGGEMAASLLPKLEAIRLLGLPNLVSFSELKCGVVLPSLKRAAIVKCPNMKNLSLAAPNLEDFTTDFNVNDLGGVNSNVSYDRLKKLFIEEGWSEEELNMNTQGCMSVFSCSIARKLVNLRSLWIIRCREMVKVIEDEDEVEEDEVASGGITTLVFPKLEDLYLEHLPKLVSFCKSRKCAVEMPSLRQVTILDCPIMKCFSLGPLTAPNLESIEINRENFGDKRDLNVALQQHYSARAKERKEEAEEEEGGKEDKGSKGEIEDKN